MAQYSKGKRTALISKKTVRVVSFQRASASGPQNSKRELQSQRLSLWHSSNAVSYFRTCDAKKFPDTFSVNFAPNNFAKKMPVIIFSL